MPEVAYSPQERKPRRPNGKNSNERNSRGDSSRPKREELRDAIKMTESVSNRKTPEVTPVDPAEFPRLREEYRRNVEKLVQESKGEIIVTSHKMPDDDAIGSALAQKRILQKLYPDKKFTVVFSENRIDAWDKFLKDPTEVTWAGDKKDSSRKGDVADYVKDNDALLCLDGGQFMRFSSQLDELRKKNINTAILDHHQDPLDKATVKYVEKSATSTCELLAKMYGPENLSPDVCEVLLLGILGDTKTFSFADDYTETKKIAEQLAKKCGKTFEQISAMVKRSEQENLYKKLYKSHLKKIPATPFVPSQTYSYITPEEKKPTLPTLHDRYDHSTGRREAMFEMQQEGDTELYWTALPDASSGDVIPSYKISFRRSRKSTIDLNAIAKEFNDGAGHAGAAAGGYTLTEDQRKEIAEKKKEGNFNEIEYACTLIATHLGSVITQDLAKRHVDETIPSVSYDQVPEEEKVETIFDSNEITNYQHPEDSLPKDRRPEDEVRAEIEEIVKSIPPKEAPMEEKKKVKGIKARLKKLWDYLKSLFKKKPK